MSNNSSKRLGLAFTTKSKMTSCKARAGEVAASLQVIHEEFAHTKRNSKQHVPELESKTVW
jgi:hypothetical protein